MQALFVRRPAVTAGRPWLIHVMPRIGLITGSTRHDDGAYASPADRRDTQSLEFAVHQLGEEAFMRGPQVGERDTSEDLTAATIPDANRVAASESEGSY